MQLMCCSSWMSVSAVSAARLDWTAFYCRALRAPQLCTSWLNQYLAVCVCLWAFIHSSCWCLEWKAGKRGKVLKTEVKIQLSVVYRPRTFTGGECEVCEIRADLFRPVLPSGWSGLHTNSTGTDARWSSSRGLDTVTSSKARGFTLNHFNAILLFSVFDGISSCSSDANGCWWSWVYMPLRSLSDLPAWEMCPCWGLLTFQLDQPSIYLSGNREISQMDVSCNNLQNLLVSLGFLFCVSCRSICKSCVSVVPYCGWKLRWTVEGGVKRGGQREEWKAFQRRRRGRVGQGEQLSGHICLTPASEADSLGQAGSEQSTGGTPGSKRARL